MQVTDELQDILAKMMYEDKSALDLLRNNAKVIGGVLGSETAFFAGKKYQNEFWLDKNEVKFYDIDFKRIEKTSLGKQIKSQIYKLESRNRQLVTQITEFKNH